jgi:hypothetical protein
LPPSTPSDIARRILDGFNESDLVPLDIAIAEALIREGLDAYEADIEAARMLPRVLRVFQGLDPAQLPFEVTPRARPRLLGKARPRPADFPGDIEARVRRELIEPMWTALVNLTTREFEFLSASLMRLMGATDTHTTEPGDEGGIDIYGRLPIRVGRDALPGTPLRSNLLNRDIFFVGQAKRIGRENSIERPEIDKFAGQIKACLDKYEGNPHPPVHRVPGDYYTTGEVVLPVYLTAGSFSGGAVASAESRSIVLCDGRLIAEVLVAHSVALRRTSTGEFVDPAALREWAVSDIPRAN